MIDVSPDQLSIILHILRRHAPDYEVRVFGSRYKWTAKEYSDLDLVLVGDEAMHWKKIAEIKGEFEESGLPFRVDVLDWYAISPEFRKVILDGGFEVIQEKSGDFQSKGWQSFKLKDLCVKIGSGATPRGGKETYLDKGDYALIRSQNILDFFFSHDGLAFINEDQAKQLNNVVVQERDVLLNITGDSVARVCQPPNDILPARVNQHVAIIRTDQSKLLPEFLKYYLLNPSYKNYLLSLASVGATRNALTKGMIEDLDIDLPPLSTQRRIADILSALDEKIELNRQMNATLGAIAQAIFREWFVEFNYPGATGEMVESELGLIPKGWRVGKLGEIIELAYGKGLKSENRIEGEYLVVGSSGIVGNHNEYFVEGPGIVIGRKGTIGEVIWLHKNFFPIDTTFYIKDSLGIKDLYFHYFLLKEQDFKKIGSDSAVPGLNRNQAHDIFIVIPQIELIEQFNTRMNAIFEEIYNNEQQIATLSSLRDALLPKLMSGEIEVENVAVN